MRTEVLKILKTFADEKYCRFRSKLLPRQQTVLLGVRIPVLRQLAKNIIKEQAAEKYLRIPLSSLEYDEELMLYGMLLAKKMQPLQSQIADIKTFVSYIGNWAVCDTFCADLKEVKNNPEIFYKEFYAYSQSEQEYEIRFFYVLALNYFLRQDFLPRLFSTVAKQKYTGFYDKMAVAWFLSEAYVKFPAKTETFLRNTRLDNFVFCKTVSKICDSFRVTEDAKTKLKALASYKSNAD